MLITDIVYLVSVTEESRRHDIMFDNINDAYNYANSIKDSYDYIIIRMNTKITSKEDIQIIDMKYHGI